MNDLLVIALAPVAFLAAVLFGFWFNWLVCRLRAERCPNPKCGSKWCTMLEGEWDGEELWNCTACGRCWTVRYPKEK